MANKKRRTKIINSALVEIMLIIGAFTIVSSVSPLTFDGLKMLNGEGFLMGIGVLLLAIFFKVLVEEDD